jgi:hypothetical protein
MFAADRCSLNKLRSHNYQAKLGVNMKSCNNENGMKIFTFCNLIWNKIFIEYSRAPVSTDSVSAVYRGPKTKWKIKEINGSQVSKRAPSENVP